MPQLTEKDVRVAVLYEPDKKTSRFGLMLAERDTQ